MFSKVGDVKRIVMGLDKVSLTPCGFCFVVYYTRADTEDCVKYINGMTLDDRPVCPSSRTATRTDVYRCQHHTANVHTLLHGM